MEQSAPVPIWVPATRAGCTGVNSTCDWVSHSGDRITIPTGLLPSAETADPESAVGVPLGGAQRASSSRSHNAGAYSLLRLPRPLPVTWAE